MTFSNRSRVSLTLLAALACSTFAAGPTPVKGPSHAPPRVVILSWDGAKPDVLRSLLAQGHLPTFKGLQDGGRWTLEAHTIVPSLTLPSHVSMTTGLLAAGHGVTWNSDRPDKGPLKVPTVFSLAREAGLRVALIVGKTKLALLAGPGAPDCQVVKEGGPEDVARLAVQAVRQRDPDLLFVHFGAPDAAGHDFGWGDTAAGRPPSPEYEAALCSCDEATGKLLAALRSDPRWAHTLLILTADHGGLDKNHGGEDPQETTIPWIASGGLVAARGVLKVPVHTTDTAATALAALGLNVPADWNGKPVPGVLAEKAPAVQLKPAA
jgi:predicted AlkP superfamily pyrophosphatase or phosphodiesterase